MAYIGKSPIIGNFVKLDAITAVNGQAAYTMQNGGANFTDYESVNQFLVSLNGTIQSPGSSFTVSSSTITFSSNLATGDVIDFIMVFGNSLSAGTPTDATVSTAKIVDDAVTAAKLNTDVISAQTALGAEPADTDEFLVSDAGVLKRVDYSYIKGGGTLEKIATADYSSGVANFTLTDCFSSSYPIYKVYLYNVLAAADDAELRAYFLDSGASTVGNWQIVSDGAYITYSDTSTNGVTSQAQDASDNIRFTGEDLQSEANKVTTLEMTIYQPYESAHTVVHFNYILNADNDYLYKLNGMAYLSSTTSLRSLKFQTSTGTNFSSYKTVIYGVKTS
jgi:hypothetical protein